MNVFRKAERRGVFIKLAVTGPSGSGKTTGAIRLARGIVGPAGRIAVIDTENRSASLYDDLDDFDVLDIEAPYEQQMFTEAIEAAVSGGYDVLVIDSFSHVWEAILAYKDQLDRRGGNSFANWNQAGEKFKDVLNSLLRARLHVIACMRAKMDYVLEESAGKKTVRKVGLGPIMRDGIEFEFTTVFDLDMSHNAATSKDRTRLFDGRIFQLTPQVGQSLGQWLKGAKPEDFAGAVADAATTPKVPEKIPESATLPATAPVRSCTPEQVAKLREYQQVEFCRPLIAQAIDKAGAVSIDTLTEHQAGKTIAWIQAKMNAASEAGYKPEPKTEPAALCAWPADMLAWIEPHGEKVTHYLVRIKWLESGQSWRDLSAERIEKIRTKSDTFSHAADIPAFGKAAA